MPRKIAVALLLLATVSSQASAQSTSGNGGGAGGTVLTIPSQLNLDAAHQNNSYTTLTPTTSTTVLPANAKRVSLTLQPDGVAPVGVDPAGGVLLSCDSAPLYFPAGDHPSYEFVTKVPGSAVTAMSCASAGTNQKIRFIEGSSP